MSTINELPDDRWIIGWDRIGAFLGELSRDTVKKLHSKYGLPVHFLPSGKPAIIVSEVNNWLRIFSELSSPFRPRRVFGAALVSVQGGLIGATAESKKKEEKRRMYLRLSRGGISDSTLLSGEEPPTPRRAAAP